MGKKTEILQCPELLFPAQERCSELQSAVVCLFCSWGREQCLKAALCRGKGRQHRDRGALQAVLRQGSVDVGVQWGSCKSEDAALLPGVCQAAKALLTPGENLGWPWGCRGVFSTLCAEDLLEKKHQDLAVYFAVLFIWLGWEGGQSSSLASFSTSASPRVKSSAASGAAPKRLPPSTPLSETVL